jgi:hypothetical protein
MARVEHVRDYRFPARDSVSWREWSLASGQGTAAAVCRSSARRPEERRDLGPKLVLPCSQSVAGVRECQNLKRRNAAGEVFLVVRNAGKIRNSMSDIRKKPENQKFEWRCSTLEKLDPVIQRALFGRRSESVIAIRISIFRIDATLMA